MRLNRYLASAGLGSRRNVEEFIISGRVRVNGKVVTDLACTVQTTDTVLFDDDPIVPNELVYLAINKPEGVITTASDEMGRPTVLSLLPPMKARVMPVGRLDADTTGLLILTNDGELAHRLSHPSYELGKTYRATLRGRIEQEMIDRITAGVWLAEGKTKPAKVTVVFNSPDKSVCDITISEGFNREVRRIFAKVGLKVKNLVRIALGPIELGDLPIGKIRKLNEDEVAMLQNSTRVRKTSFKLPRNRDNAVQSKRTRNDRPPFKSSGPKRSPAPRSTRRKPPSNRGER